MIIDKDGHRVLTQEEVDNMSESEKKYKRYMIEIGTLTPAEKEKNLLLLRDIDREHLVALKEQEIAADYSDIGD